MREDETSDILFFHFHQQLPFEARQTTNINQNVLNVASNFVTANCLLHYKWPAKLLPAFHNPKKDINQMFNLKH